MTDYRVAKAIKTADHFYLNINFEILNGCKFNCQGCFVEKNSQNPFAVGDIDNLDALLDDSERNGYLPFIAFIGPTDFLAAENFIIALSDERFIQLLRRFKRVVLQTTFLSLRNADQCAEVIRNNFSDRELEINIVVESKLLYNETYLSKIRKNKIKFLDLLDRPNIKSFAIMNVYNFEETQNFKELSNYFEMNSRIKSLFGATIDYNFSAGRKLDISPSEFRDITEITKNIFDNSIGISDDNRNLRFSFGKMTDSLLERQLNYREGQLYYSPLLYERFVAFHSELKIGSTDMRIQDLEDYFEKKVLQQFQFAEKTDECAICPFVATCVERGVLLLMEIYQQTSCIVAKKAMSKIANSSTENRVQNVQ